MAIGVGHPGQRVGVAVTSEFADLDGGWPLLHSALIEVGLEPVITSWDGERGAPVGVGAVLANYCWGYVSRREEFLAWAGQVQAASRLVNPLEVLAWNTTKTYLGDLAAAGVPVVPTAFVAPGERWQPPSDDYVVKPAVGSGGWWAARYHRSPATDALRHVRLLHEAGQTVLVQTYQRAVDSAGETAMVFFDGAYSHAVHKGPLLDADAGVTEALWEREVVTAAPPPGAHLDLARATMSAVTALVGPTCYARVDVVDGNDGVPVVLEVELVEPSLFLHLVEGSAARFARAVRSWMPLEA